MGYSATLENPSSLSETEPVIRNPQSRQSPHSSLPNGVESYAVETKYSELRAFGTYLSENESSLQLRIVIPYVGLMVSLLFAGTFANFAAILLISFTAIAIACLSHRSKCLSHSGVFRMDSSGLCLPLGLERHSTDVAFISWRDLQSVWLGTSKGPALGSSKLTLSFKSQEWGSTKKEFMKIWGANNSSRQMIELDLRAFPKREQSRILAALHRILPIERIHPNLHDNKPLADTSTYTSIWLDSLGISPRRLTLNTLDPGIFLHNGRYEILRCIVTGGQATTYEAIDHRAKIECGEPWHVVLKEFVIPVHGDNSVAEEMCHDVETATRIMISVAGEHIVKLLDSFAEDFRIYFVLEFVEGETLKDTVLSTKCLQNDQVIELGIQMCEILAVLHEMEDPVVHRDFTPDNLILTPNGQLKLIDFDVAINQNQQSNASVVGKPSYLAPEQFRGQAVCQSDIYSLGATLFFLLTAKEPTPIAVSHPRTLQSSVDERLDLIVAKATAISLSSRYQTVRDLAADLQSLRSAAE